MYVRKTQTLVDDIEHEVFRMQQNALSQLNENNKVEIGTPLHDEFKTAIEKTLWQEAPDIKDKIPNSWCKFHNEITTIYDVENHTTVRYSFETQDGDELKLPPTYSKWDSHKIPEKFRTPLIQEWLASRHKATATQDTIKADYETIREQLVGFMGKHASLNTALKEMPELKLYVPNHYIDKVEKKENRIKAKPSAPTTNDDVEVDVDALTRAAIAHRVTTAGS